MAQPFQKKVKEITGAYTLTLSDLSYAIRCNSASPFEVSLPATPTGFPNFHVDLINVGAGAVTCNGLTLLQGNGLQLYCNGSAWTNMKLLNEVKVADVPAMTSAELASKISDETGTGVVVFNTSPNLITPTFGDVGSGNYSTFEADGTLVFNGNATVYDDIWGELISEKLESPSSRITQDVAEGTVVFATNADLTDYIVMNIQISHSWKMGSELHPHLHWIQSQNNNPNWLIQYRWQRNGQSKTTAWASTPLATNAFTYVSGDLNQISGFPVITPPTDYRMSDILQFRILRDTANTSGLFAGADPYTTSVHAYSFDNHYIKDRVGSRVEYDY